MPLTASINRPFYTSDLEGYPVAANVRIFKGAALGENGSGFVRPLVAGDPFVGFADEECDNTGGAAGAKTVTAKVRGAIELPVTGLVIADNARAAVYASDDGTFNKTASGNSLIGTCRRFISAGLGIVEYDAQAVTSAV